MSKEKKSKPSKDARNGQLPRLGLVIVPVLPLAYGVKRVDWDASASVVATMLSPWVMASVALGLLFHALHRIDTNVLSNPERPFTPKDAHVFRRSTAVTLGLAFYLAISAYFDWGLSKAQRDVYFESLSALALVAIVVAMVSATLDRIHTKGMSTHESLTKVQAELEKGV